MKIPANAEGQAMIAAGLSPSPMPLPRSGMEVSCKPGGYHSGDLVEGHELLTRLFSDGWTEIWTGRREDRLYTLSLPVGNVREATVMIEPRGESSGLPSQPHAESAEYANDDFGQSRHVGLDRPLLDLHRPRLGPRDSEEAERLDVLHLTGAVTANAGAERRRTDNRIDTRLCFLLGTEVSASTSEHSKDRPDTQLPGAMPTEEGLEFLEGTILGGRYCVLRRIGQNGTSRIYLVQDQKSLLGRTLALKVPRRAQSLEAVYCKRLSALSAWNTSSLNLATTSPLWHARSG
jgi:hypothetical protein